MNEKIANLWFEQGLKLPTFSEETVTKVTVKCPIHWLSEVLFPGYFWSES